MSETDFLAEAAKKHQLNKNQIIALLGEDRHEKELFAAADAVRKEFVGDEVHLRGLIEFSNICKNNCLYCGLRRDNRNLKRYRMSPEEIVALATRAVREYGFKTIVMQSGEDLWFTPERLKPILTEIKKLDVAVTLSIGEKTFAEYAAYREAGADRYLIRIETTDKDLYHRLDPGMSWEERKQCLLNLGKLGYEVGSGIMVGLPGQTLESVADDLLFLKELNIDMAGTGNHRYGNPTPGRTNYRPAMRRQCNHAKRYRRRVPTVISALSGQSRVKRNAVAFQNQHRCPN